MPSVPSTRVDGGGQIGGLKDDPRVLPVSSPKESVDAGGAVFHPAAGEHKPARVVTVLPALRRDEPSSRHFYLCVLRADVGMTISTLFVLFDLLI
ncbi:unnamed protein product [Linum trigynum]|uniref:Uncharacterized protein n=1 Tax=Linum trigynum TaxID=586398 RepID=A0AAV2GDW2_9ROSI